MAPLVFVFDIDDTLYLERDYARSGFVAVGQWAARWIDPGFAPAALELFESGLRGSIFDAALRRLGREPAPELISTLVELYRTHTPAIELLEDARQAVAQLQALGVHMAIVTDGPAASQSRKAEALGLGGFASPIILTGTYGQACAKPSPWAFRQVAAALPALHYVYVGDNPRKDFAGPQSLGWTTVRLRRPGGLHYAVENSEPPPAFEFADCSALPELARSLLGRNGS